jgi:hypothetical protein
MTSMVRSLLLALAGLAAGLLLALSAPRAQATGCPQWETMLAQPGPITVVQPAEVGKPTVEKAPAGWEPFAYSPSGQLVYRRCAR